MSLNAQIWVSVLLATLTSVSCRPEQPPIESPQEPVLSVRSGEIQMQPEDDAVRNSRAYTTRDGNDAYWMFHTPSRPVMYIPEYNAVLIPAGARGSGRPQNMMLKPAQPPRRRRPLVDLIRYMQGKTSGEVDEAGHTRFSTQEVAGMDQREHDELLDKMRHLVNMGVLDSIQIISQLDNDQDSIKEVTNEKEIMKTSENQKVKIESSEKTSNKSKDAFVHQNDKQRSNPIHSQLFQRETKYPADHSRGYHFSYKYVIPHNHHNVAQVSVQQRSSPPLRQPFFGTIPTQVPHLHYIAENKQVPLPRVIERKNSVPLQMISLRKEVEDEKDNTKPAKETEIKPASANVTENVSNSGITQAIPLAKPITNYHSPRPEIQQAITFDKIPQKSAAPKPASREETLKRKEEQKDLLQSIGLQQEEKKEEGQQEKRVSVKFDNKHGGVSEIKVNTKVKSSSVESDLDPKDGISMASLQDVPLVQVQTHTRKQTVNIMDSRFDKQTADAMKIGFLMGSVQGDKDSDQGMFPVDEDGASPRVYLREAPLPEETSNEMVVFTGKKPSELILSPVARAVAGPKGVAIAAPVAKAYVRGGEEVMLQFDPDSVAIAGPGGRAHSHPRLIVTYMEDKPK